MTEHTGTHEVISAFIDNEPFDAQALARALADPGGRDLLIDLIALKQIVTADVTGDVQPAPVATRARWRLFAAAAALVLAIGGGYAIGHEFAGRTAEPSAPAPTRVIDLKPGVDWHQTAGGH